MTILEAMIAVAIAGVAMAGVVAMIEQVSTGTAEQKFMYEGTNLNEDIRMNLASTAACFNTFRNIKPLLVTAGTTSQTAFAGPIYGSSPTAVMFADGEIYGDHAVKIRDMWLNNNYPDPAAGGTLTLGFDFDALAKVTGANSMVRTIGISYSVDNTGALTSCVANAKATDGLWKIVKNTNIDIYYAAGKVGIGIPPPVYPLDVASAGAVAARLNGSYGLGGTNNSQLRFAGGKDGDLWAIGTDVVTGAGTKDFHLYALPNAGNGAALTAQALTGNIGIGTSVPNANIKLDVRGAGSFRQSANNWVQIGTSPSINAQLVTNGGVVQFQNGNGMQMHFGDNANFPNSNLALVEPKNVNSATSGFAHTDHNVMLLSWIASIPWGQGGIYSGVGQWGTVSKHPFELYAGNTTQITLSPAIPNHPANVYIGVPTSVQSDALAPPYGFAVGPNAIFQHNVQVDGTVTANSDRSLKRSIAKLDHPLEQLLRLEGVAYFWRDSNIDRIQHLGLIAQDVEKVYPTLVHTNDKGVKALSYLELLAPIIEAIKSIYQRLVGTEDALKEIKSELAKTRDELQGERKKFDEYRARIEARLKALEKH